MSFSSLGSAIDGPSPPRWRRIPDGVDPPTPCYVMMILDYVDLVTPVTDAVMLGGADAPMTLNTGAPAISCDTTLRSGLNHFVVSRILINKWSPMGLYRCIHKSSAPMFPWRACCPKFLRIRSRTGGLIIR